jgi:hypothetical protein
LGMESYTAANQQTEKNLTARMASLFSCLLLLLISRSKLIK